MVSKQISLTWNKPSLLVSWSIQLKFSEVQPLMSQNPPLSSCFIWIFRFSLLKESADLPQLLWLYVMLLHTPLDCHPEANVHILK